MVRKLWKKSLMERTCLNLNGSLHTAVKTSKNLLRILVPVELYVQC